MKILYVTTISLTMNSFFKPHIEMLVREGNQVDIACNYKDLPLDSFYNELGCNFYQIDFSRSPLSTNNIKAIKILERIVEENGYDIVHCHTPVASICTRLACRKLRKYGVKVFYTAHGFHFYKGAHLKNWLLYYPVEKLCSRWTDVLITINHEDYDLAKKKMKAKRVEYVPGAGIDVDKFKNTVVDKSAKRRELGIPEEAFLLVSVGELNKNKNHQVVIKALAELNNPRIHYIIAGIGSLKDYLIDLASRLGVSDQIHLLGYRNDVAELYNASDVCIFPSIREGLPVALMESMACDLPVICSRIRGNTDLIGKDSNFLVEPDDVDGVTSAIKRLIENPSLCRKFGERNLTIISKFETTVILDKMNLLYKNC